MRAEVSALIGFPIAAVTALVTTPVAIALARRTKFYDHPREYRRHHAPTPFLGGAAVYLSFLVAAVALGDLSGDRLVLVGGALAMWLLGTMDDRDAIPPIWRLIPTAAVAVALYTSGLGWDTAAGEGLNIVLTVAWTVGLVNAFNLTDNLDGACSTVGAVSAAGVGVVATIKGQDAIAGLAFALSGACTGFLPWNLAGPARIFLGDGGSMPIGFLVAALAMATARHSAAGNAGLLMGALLVGLPILDVTLVSVSRTRRGVSLMTGGRDHLTHRLLLRLRSPRVVAALLACGQGLLCLLAVIGYKTDTEAVAILAFAAFAVGFVAVLVLDAARWRPPGIAVRAEPLSSDPLPIDSAQPSSIGVDSG